MTSSVTPNPAIHNVPALDSGQFTPLDWQQLIAWGQALLNEIENWVALALLNVNILGVKPFAALQQFGADPAGIISTAIAALNGSGSGIAQFEAALKNIPGGNVIGPIAGAIISGVTATEQQLIDNICNALGIPGSGHTLADVLTALENIPASVIRGIGAIEQQIIDTIVQILNNTLGTGNPLSALVSSLQNALQGLLPALFNNGDGTASPVSGFINNGDGTGIFTSVPNSLYTLINNFDGSASTMASLLQSVIPTGQYGTANWSSLLGQTGTSSAGQFASLLQGLIPPLVNNGDGTAVATSVSGIVNNLDGTGAQLVQSATTAVTQLVDNLDGTATTVAKTIQNVEQATQTSITTAVSNVQQTIDGLSNALSGTVGVINQTVQSVESGFAGFFTNFFNAWTGSSHQTVTAAQDIPAAATQASMQAQAQAQKVAAIEAQLPHFYGGSGTSGIDVQVQFTGGAWGLPGTFTSTSSTIAWNAAFYNTPSTTDEQTVDGIWSATDAYSKYLFLRGNAAHTTYVYAKLQNNTPFSGTANCELGCVIAGAKTVFTTFTLPGGGSLAANANYSLEATDYAFTVTGPNGLSVSFSDISHVSQLGSNYRYGGFGTDGYALSTFIDTGGSATYYVPGGVFSGDRFDFAGVGGGGGGRTLVAGGAAGSWNGLTLTYGVDFPTSTTSFPVYAGHGGSYSGGTAWNGEGSAVNIAGYSGAFSQFYAAGGTTGGSGNPYGQAPGNYVFNNTAYFGATAAAFLGQAGNPPGGGGGEASAPAAASPPGAAGKVWITPVSRAVPGSMASWAFYDSGPNAGPGVAYVATYETTTSSGYTDLATTTDQVTVTVGASGMVLLSLRAWIDAAAGTTGCAGFAVSGVSTLAADDSNALMLKAPTGSTSGMASGMTFLKTGLNPGATTFKMKYRNASGATSGFYEREIAAVPL